MSALCAPEEFLARRVQYCPTCNARRRFVVALYGWYPPIATCVSCADWGRAGTWADAVRASVRSAIGAP